MRRVLIALACLGILGCASPSIVRLTVESDLTVPAELDEVVMEIEGRSASARLTDGASLPAMLELRASGDRLGPFELIVIGRRAGTEVARVTRSIAFTQGSTVAITVRLEADCAGVSCDPGERCEAGACVRDGIDGGMPDAGEPSDGGVSEGGGPDACVAESCNARDDDCDGEIDETGCEPCTRVVSAERIYQFCDLRRSGDAAVSECAARGYVLVVIDDAAESDFLQAQRGLLSDEPYIGLRRMGADFAWIDGSPFTFMPWQGGGAGSGDCVIVRSNGQWRSEDCAVEHSFVCELAL